VKKNWLIGFATTLILGTTIPAMAGSDSDSDSDSDSGWSWVTTTSSSTSTTTCIKPTTTTIRDCQCDYVCGDMNLNGDATVTDALLLMQYAVELATRPLCLVLGQCVVD
jgi:hypothetical protein